jgi:hypothetical protein
MDNQAVNEAIEILINNFTRHPSLSSQTNDGLNKLNVIDLLQEFWTMKLSNSTGVVQANTNELIWTLNDVNIIYEFIETPEPPFVCFVTLPGGACFATFQVNYLDYFLFKILSN